jgi:predicted phosphate transport protein (TIGR00153 family)
MPLSGDALPGAAWLQAPPRLAAGGEDEKGEFRRMVRLVPREVKFFSMFAEMSGNVTDGARLLLEILQDFQNVETRLQRLQEIEHRGDDMTHAVITKLNQTFITPFDREDIHRLATTLDDVLDYVHAAGERLTTYKITQRSPRATRLAELIVRQSEQIAKAISLLDKHDTVLEYCVEINRLENEADSVAREAIGRLFEEEKDPIALIKMKELYEVLEMATDKAEDVANVLETVILKSA